MYVAAQADLLVVPGDGSAPPLSLASNVYPYAVTADTTNVYFADGLMGGSVVAEPTATGLPLTLASGQSYPDAIAASGAYVYFTTGSGGTGTVMRVPKAGGPAIALATGQAYPTGVAVNATRVFWANFGDGTIRSAPK